MEKSLSYPFLEVGQLVEETLILRSGTGNDPIQDGPGVEDLLLVDTVAHLLTGFTSFRLPSSVRVMAVAEPWPLDGSLFCRFPDRRLQLFAATDFENGIRWT